MQEDGLVWHQGRKIENSSLGVQRGEGATV